MLGAGFMGGIHARAYAQLPDVEVIGVSSRSREKAAELARDVGGEAFTDARELALYRGIDAVSVTLPTHLHREYVVAALEAGKHVFVEKPMELTIEACDEMIEAARSNGRILMVAHVLRMWPEYRTLVRAVEQGAIGRPFAATARRLSTRPSWGEWFTHPEWTGGGFFDMQVHDLDVLNWLFGRPKRVFSRGVRGARGGWDHVLTLADYDGVATMAEASVMMPDSYPFTMALEVVGDGGALEFRFRAQGEGVETGAEVGTALNLYRPGQAPERLRPDAETDAYVAEVAYFVDSVRAGVVGSALAPQRGREAVRAALAARQALESGRPVDL